MSWTERVPLIVRVVGLTLITFRALPLSLFMLLLTLVSSLPQLVEREIKSERDVPLSDG